MIGSRAEIGLGTQGPLKPHRELKASLNCIVRLCFSEKEKDYSYGQTVADAKTHHLALQIMNAVTMQYFHYIVTKLP